MPSVAIIHTIAAAVLLAMFAATIDIAYEAGKRRILKNANKTAKELELHIEAAHAAKLNGQPRDEHGRFRKR